jgi:hypothetical protein
MPAVEAVEQRLMDLRSPSLLVPRQRERRDPRQPQRRMRLRQRLLTLPVLVALVVSLVWRRMPAVAEVHRGVAQAGLWGLTPLRVSPQAMTQRLDAGPAAVMGQLFTEVWARLQTQAPPSVLLPRWTTVRAHFSRIALVDGSTLEAVRTKTRVLQAHAGLVRGGKLRVRGDACSHGPLWQR